MITLIFIQEIRWLGSIRGCLGLCVDAVAKLISGSDYHTVISMGGDGTFAEAAKAILKAQKGNQVRLGMLPAGTANDQGRSFGLRSGFAELPRNITVLAKGHECGLDAGRIEALDSEGLHLREDYFFDSTGWGLSPRVLQLRNRNCRSVAQVPVLRHVWKGRVVYAGALARTFLGDCVSDASFSADIVADGVKHSFERLTDLIVKGTRVYGGSWIFDKNALPDDGKFEVVPFTGRRDWVAKAIVHHDYCPLPPKSAAGFSAARMEFVFRPRGRRVPLLSQIDGEEFIASDRARIEVLHRAIRLIVPAAYIGGDA